jgi:polar amino acid transport system substrate-binding protein
MLRWVWLVLALALAGTTAAAAERIRYCDYPVYPPISWSDGKQVRGLAPSVVKSLFGHLGYEVDVVVLGNWKRCLLDAAEGRVDVVLAYSTAQREQSMRFSTVPVLREEVAVFVNRKHPVKFERLEDLGNYRGRIDFITQERRTGQLFVEHLPGAADIEALPHSLSVDYLRIAVSRRSALAERMPDIDAELQRMVDAGEIQRWLNESEAIYRDMINLPANAQ